MFSVVNEYIMRKRLYELGFTAADLFDLDAETAEQFIIISNELDTIKREAEKRAQKGGKK
jgi:hypothetical protein